jgi:hypothetical protein
MLPRTAAAWPPQHRCRRIVASSPKQHNRTAAPLRSIAVLPPKRITAAAPRCTALPQHHSTSTASPPHLGRPKGRTAAALPHGRRFIAPPCAAASPQHLPSTGPQHFLRIAAASPQHFATSCTAAALQHCRSNASPLHLCPSRQTHSAAPPPVAAPVEPPRPLRRTAPHHRGARRRRTASLQPEHRSTSATSPQHCCCSTAAAPQHHSSIAIALSAPTIHKHPAAPP